jgi:hypothetical protein
MEIGIFNISLRKTGRLCSGNLQGLLYSTKVQMSKSKLKTVFICFFDSKAIVCWKLALPDQTVMQKFYSQVLEHLRQEAHHVRLEFFPQLVDHGP